MVLNTFTAIHSVVATRPGTDIGNGIVVSYYYVATLHYDIARTNVTVHQAHLMKLPERIAKRIEPPQNHHFHRRLADFLTIQFQHTAQIGQGSSFYPLHECDETITLPL